MRCPQPSCLGADGGVQFCSLRPYHTYTGQPLACRGKGVVDRSPHSGAVERRMNTVYSCRATPTWLDPPTRG
eukprot:5323604-Prymnesium_polylepis.2